MAFLIDLFTEAEHKSIMQTFDRNPEAAIAYNNLLLYKRGKVQELNYRGKVGAYDQLIRTDNVRGWRIKYMGDSGAPAAGMPYSKRGKLISLFTPAEHERILLAHDSNYAAARSYNSRLGSESVSPELVTYWRKVFITNKGKVATANKSIQESRVLTTPNPKDDLGDTFIPDVAERILVIPDTHAPYVHKDALAFLEAVRDVFEPDLVVHLGDEVDHHALSFHDSDPNLDSASQELYKSRAFLDSLYGLFPNLLVCDSNHGSLAFRRAKKHGIPVDYLKKYREILFPDHLAPAWSWGDSWMINTPQGPVTFKHQATGSAIEQAAHEGTNLVVGHEHAKFEVTYRASDNRLYYAGYAGCLVDRSSMAFSYGKVFPKKPVLGCMIIIDGVPNLIPMMLDSDGNWIVTEEF